MSEWDRTVVSVSILGGAECRASRSRRKYRAVKSVAHNFGHSFVSLTNYMADDYVIWHLARAAAASRQPELRVDILSGGAEPAALVVPLVRSSLDWYAAWFPGLLRDHGIRRECVVHTGTVRDAWPVEMGERSSALP